MMALGRKDRRAVGTLVVHKDEPIGKATIRVVVGYKSSGKCMTVFAEPLPWIPNTIQVVAEALLREVPTPSPKAYRRKDCLQCPLRAGCESALGAPIDAVKDKACFMQRELRPCA